jgi:hypothetical protein
MVGKIVVLPFWLAAKVVGIAGNAIKMVVIVAFRGGRFFVRRVFGGAFGAIAGLILGYRHVNIRLFAGRKR